MLIRASGEEEIRFSWWKNGKMVTRPLDLSENDLIEFFQSALDNEVFTAKFKSDLRDVLQSAER